MKKYPSHCCQHCGEPIGWLGRFLTMIFPRWHICKDPLEYEDNWGV